MSDTLYKIALTLSIGLLLLAVLPVSPFQNFVNELNGVPYLAYLNWFFPVGKCLAALAIWTTAISLYYGYQWILRQLGITGS